MAAKRKTESKEKSTKKAKTQSAKKSSLSSKGHKDAIPYPDAIDSSSLVEVTTKLTVTLAPIYSADAWSGVHEELNNMLLRFVPQIRGVVLSYSKVKILESGALLFNDSPYGQLHISARLLLWRPICGMSLKGRINVQSPDHIGLLLWDTFNASIPASFIPKDKYEWRAFNDDEITAHMDTFAQKNGAEDDDDEDDNSQGAGLQANTSANTFGSGEWVLKGTSQCVGTDGQLDFVIVDVIKANEVLSVTGALH